MSQKTKTELAMIKPLSKFVEHFDLMPPTELLDDELFDQQDKRPVSPLSASPNRLWTKYPSHRSIKSAEPSHIHTIPHSPTSPITDIRDYSRNMPPKSPVTNSDLDNSVGQNQGSSAQAIARYSKATRIQAASPTPPKEASVKPSMNSDNLNITTNQDYVAPNSGKAKLSRDSLNKADIIIKRYEAWSNFLSLVIFWVNEISRQSLQSERSFSSLLKESRFSNLKGNSGQIESAKGIHSIVLGFTADLALQEQQFGHCVKEQVPVLEKFKKECATHIKDLKSRSDLALDEFLKRAEVTASLMAQLNKTCKEARRTIERGAQLTNDPWIVNLYVLRQLKREVDEENRQRRLMVPIQQTALDFETRLLKAVEETIKICFTKLGKGLAKEKLDSLETSLNVAVADNWNAFVLNNKKDIVNESNPNKHYLKINYPCKNDRLVMTLHKGALERKSGVLSKYTKRFFVLTESGFLHQFKLSDKVSPESSIYIPKTTIIPDTDISHLNLASLCTEIPDKQSSHSFEIHRSGSVLQRDKSYVFRTSTFAEMVVWCRLLCEVATRPIISAIQPYRPPISISDRSLSAQGSVGMSDANPSSAQNPQQTTPPPSPIQHLLPKSLQIDIDRINNVADDIPQYAMQQPTASPTTDAIPTALAQDQAGERHRQYKPQLNI